MLGFYGFDGTIEGRERGYCFSGVGRRVFLDIGTRCRARVLKGAIMSVFYLISAILAGLLFVYLFVAMLKPEWF